MDGYSLLALISAIVIGAFLLETVTKRLRLPMVVVLMSGGLAARAATDYLGYEPPSFDMALPALGTIGLILIVLEAALDLKLDRDRRPVIVRGAVAAFVLTVGSAAAVALMIHLAMDIPFRAAMVNAAPLAIISSAIAIPSAHALHGARREFIVYESALGDIIGIMLFNFVSLGGAIGFKSVPVTALQTLSVLVISALVCITLAIYLEKITTPVKFLPLVAALALVYVAGKALHLSSLLMVFALGIFLNNIALFRRGRLAHYLGGHKLGRELETFKILTTEGVFFLKTFFFVVFGYSIKFTKLLDLRSALLALLILALVFLIRYVYLALIEKREELSPELFLAPRGLITILLYLSIASGEVALTEGLVATVVLGSCLVMTGGLMVVGGGQV